MSALIAIGIIVVLFNLAAIIRIHLEVRALKRYTHTVVVNDSEAFSVAVDQVTHNEREKRRDLQIKMNNEYRKTALDTLANIADSEAYKPEDRIIAASQLFNTVSPVTSTKPHTLLNTHPHKYNGR